MIRRLSGSNHRSLSAVAALLAATVAIAAAACSDLTGVPASLATTSDSGTVWAINGAPLGAPTALSVYSGALVAADADFTFDVAFDLDSTGGVIVLPQPAVASGLATPHTVGLIKDTVDTYDAITQAPASGYRADTAITIRRNQVVLVQVSDPTACAASLTGSTVYAKLVVVSVNRLARTMDVRFTTDPNCGFRSFASGIPKD